MKCQAAPPASPPAPMSAASLLRRSCAAPRMSPSTHIATAISGPLSTVPKTSGRGGSRCTAELPSGSVNTIVEHPDNAQVLFIGTEHHVFASADRGESWARFPHLPTTLYDDIVIHPREKDLVLGTHGRSIIIVEDVGPLADHATATATAAHLFAPPARHNHELLEGHLVPGAGALHGRKSDRWHADHLLAGGPTQVRPPLRCAAAQAMRCAP